MNDDNHVTEDNEAADPPHVEIPANRTGRGIFLAGVAMTVLWLLGLLSWWWNDGQAIRLLDPNEFGDFLAGIFAPVAFLWLVLGFWQQGQELRNSSNALWLQMRELQNSVRAQNDLVGATKDLRKSDREIFDAQTAEVERASKPILTVINGGGMTDATNRENYRFGFTVKNSGADAAVLSISSTAGQLKSSSRLERGSSLGFDYVAPQSVDEVHQVMIRYHDARHVPRAERWQIHTGPTRKNHDPAKLGEE